MEPLALDGNYRIVAGVFLGIACGFLMVKSQIAWRKTMMDQLFLKNTGITIDVGFFSRKREINKDSSFSVNG